MSFITYNYKCNKCGEIWELVVERENADNNQPCPQCQEEDSTRLVGAPLVLKASWPDGVRKKKGHYQDLISSREAYMASIDRNAKPEARAEAKKVYNDLMKVKE